MYHVLKSTTLFWCFVFITDLQTSQAQRCPALWVGYGNSCYRFRWVNKMTWSDAQQWCQAQTGDLVKLETLQERAWIVNQTNVINANQKLKGDLNYWIGLNDLKTVGQWVWGDKSPADASIIQWNPGEPNNIGNEDCAGVSNGRIYNRRCSTLSKYICERSRNVPLPCDADRYWQTFNGNCFKVHLDQHTWYNAKTICNQDGSDLATVEDLTDEVVVLDFAKNNAKSFWIGLQSLQTTANGQVYWTWGNNSYLNPGVSFWGNNQPRIANNRKNSSCVYVNNVATSSNAWSADWCGEKKSFICKKPEGVCPPGWIAHQRRCYQFNIQFKYSWTDARSYCDAQGSLMVQIYGNTATTFLTGYFDELRAAGVDSIWMGANDNNTDGGPFVWSHGGPIGNYTRWLHNPPVNNNGHLDCSFLSTSDSHGYWRTTSSCFVRRSFVCTVGMNQAIKTVTTPRPSFSCDRNWRLHGNMCYQFNDTRMSWKDARSACQSQGADLVKITNNDVEGFVNAGTHRQEYWIGLNDRKQERRYVWLDEPNPDPSKYFRWNKNEPNNLAGENCVETRELGWNDKDCSTKLKFICQKQARNAQLPGGSTVPAVPHYSSKCGLLWEEDPNSDYCYQFSTDVLDWEDARDMCIHQGGDLASIQTREESFYINARVQSMSVFLYWIGANDRSSEGGWKWSDGGPFAYLNWAPGEPNDYKHIEDCGVLVGKRGIPGQSFVWNDVPCTLRNQYICKKMGLSSTTTPRPTPTPTPPAGKIYGCPDYWKHYMGFCYKFFQSRITWYDAKEMCGYNGGTLASIASEDEQSYVFSQVKDINGTGFWLGLNDLVTDMNFKWIDGTKVTYTNWAPKEPNNWFTREDCVMMYINRGGYWNDGVCDSVGLITGFVCKRPQFLMSKTPKPENTGCTLPAVGYGAFCYYGVSGQTRTWQSAESDCVSRFKGHLATVNDRYVQSFLSSYMAYRSDIFWIGLSDTVTPGTYKWISGWPVTFSYWYSTHTGNERSTCAAMRRDHPRGLWENHNCTETHNYWCQYPRAGHSTAPTTAIVYTGNCPAGWTAHNQYCYKAYNPSLAANQKTWMEARDICQSMGANLASIHSQDQDDFFSGTLLSSYRTAFWMGLNDRDNENGYVWIDGSATDFTNWNRGEPNNFKNTEDCVEYAMQTRSWNDNNCYLSNSFICQIPRGIPLATTAAPPSVATSTVCGIDLSWIYYNGSCFYISTSADGTKGAFDGNQFCNAHGGSLASIHTLDENNLIFSQITKRNQGAFWIGLNELTGTSFTWIDGTVKDFDFWSPQEPNDAYGAERCVAITDRGGLWNDDNCNENYGFVCRKSTTSHNPITPSPTPLINAGCANNFIAMPNSNKCFLIQSTANVTWTAARDQCRKFGAGYDIASINSAAEQAFLVANFKGLTTLHLWIGLNNLRHHGHFVWQDNSPFTYQNWAKGEPNGHSVNAPKIHTKTVEECVEIYPTTLPWNRDPKIVGKWNDNRCTNLFGYICQGQRGTATVNPGTQCKSDYKPYGQACYKMFSPARWQNAATLCTRDGAVLTSILDLYEESFIKSVFINSNQPVWIGMTFNSQTYTWMDGWPVLYTNWGSGQPLRATNGGCVALKNGQWTDSTCSQMLNYVCKITSVTPPPQTTIPPGSCSQNQTYHNNYCYQGYPFASATWPESNYLCQKLGMNLASVHSVDELTFIWKTMILGTGLPIGYRMTPPNVWIGMTKGLSDGFTWSDATPVNYLNWNKNEPSDPLNATNEECVELYRNTGKWNDKNCYSNRGYICKQLAAKQTTLGPTTMMPITQTPGRINPWTSTSNHQTTSRNSNTQKPNTTPNPIPGINNNVPNYNGAQTQTQSSSDISGGGIAAILVAVVFVLVLVGLLTIFLKRRNGNRNSFSRGSGIDNSLYYEKSNEKVDFSQKNMNGNSNTPYEADA